MGANLSARQLNSSEKHFRYSNAPSLSAVTCGVASALRRAFGRNLAASTLPDFSVSLGPMSRQPAFGTISLRACN